MSAAVEQTKTKTQDDSLIDVTDEALTEMEKSVANPGDADDIDVPKLSDEKLDKLKKLFDSPDGMKKFQEMMKQFAKNNNMNPSNKSFSAVPEDKVKKLYSKIKDKQMLRMSKSALKANQEKEAKKQEKNAKSKDTEIETITGMPTEKKLNATQRKNKLNREKKKKKSITMVGKEEIVESSQVVTKVEEDKESTETTEVNKQTDDNTEQSK